MYNSRKKSKLEYKKWLYAFIYNGLRGFSKSDFFVWFVWYGLCIQLSNMFVSCISCLYYVGVV